MYFFHSFFQVYRWPEIEKKKMHSTTVNTRTNLCDSPIDVDSQADHGWLNSFHRSAGGRNDKRSASERVDIARCFQDIFSTRKITFLSSLTRCLYCSSLRSLITLLSCETGWNAYGGFHMVPYTYIGKMYTETSIVYLQSYVPGLLYRIFLTLPYILQYKIKYERK